MRPSRYTIRQAIKSLEWERDNDPGGEVNYDYLAVIRALEWAAGITRDATENSWVDAHFGESAEDITDSEEDEIYDE